MGALVGNPALVAGIYPIHHVIMPKVPNFPEISDETPNFHGNLVILRKPASWLVAGCERSENRGCGGGGGCRKGTKSRRAPVLSARKRSILLDYVLLGNLLTVGY